ncbi:unnamed protein product [Blepharisma stoltei]|uniref:Uncharacterized protein n=1 Tax=Blepharisma stoltei TaxID=1481888 RepID=A0AAU9IL70_9CILI|nr:unnamed protein product [Blepharisma stoltei]
MEDPLSNYLFDSDKALKDLAKAKLEQGIMYIKSSLSAYGFPEIGDLFNSDPDEVKKTIECLYAILEQRQRDMQYRSQMQERMAKLKNDKEMYMSKLDLLNEDSFSANSEAGKLQNKLSIEMQKWKKEKEKLITERDEARKDIAKLQGREGHLFHEIKKKDSEIQRLKEQLRKVLGEKDLIYQNHVDMTENLHSEGPKMFGQTGEGEFTFLVTRGYEENQASLLNENQELRSAFESLQRELHNIIKEKKEYLTNPDEALEQLELIGIQKEIFQMPFQSVSEDVVKTFEENIKRFRFFIDEICRIPGLLKNE